MVRTKVLLTIGVVALVTIAGCMGGSGGNTATTTVDEQTEPATTTEAQQTTQSNGLSSVELPAGVSQDSVAEGELLEAHQKSLQDSIYKSTVEFAIISGVNTENPTKFQQTHKIRGDTENGRLKSTGTRNGEPSQSRFYGNGSFYTRAMGESGASYTIADRSPRPSELSGSYLYKNYFQALDVEPVEADTENGDTVIKLEVTGFSDRDQLKSDLKASSVSNLTGSMTVEPSGRVTNMEFSLNFSPEEGESTGRLEVSSTTESAESLDITKPVWTADAEEKSISVDAKLTDDGVVKITPKEEPIPEGSTIYAYFQATGQSELSVDSTVEAGESFYLYVDGDSAAMSTSKPGNFDAADGFSIATVGPQGSELFRASS